MGCDGWIKNPKKPVTIDYSCYICSEDFDPDEPIKGHEGCLDTEGRLPVGIDIDNYEKR